MKKILLVVLLSFITYGNSGIYAKDKHSKRQNGRNDGPVKNIPPHVIKALKEAIASFDPYFNPDFSTSILIWSRDKNVFHVVVHHWFCMDSEPLAYNFTADILANGKIIYSRKDDIECIKIPPDLE